MNATHEVTNQPQPLVDYDLYSTNRPLRDALAFHLPGADEAPRAALGTLLGSAAMQTHARLANTHPPRLLSHDRFGHRIDRVEFHPSYHALMEAAVGAGLHGTPWSRGPGAHIERAAGFMLFTELEPSILCPVSMSYAVTPALRANAALFGDWFGKLTSTAYDPRLVSFADKSGVTMGMGMTEKQGGSDVRANTTRAEFAEDTPWGARYAITGHKWFFSAPMCDAFLVLAQAPGGLTCFFLPRVLPDGTLNALHIQRLKDKLGNHANASSEVEFHGASAWRVGDEGRGVAQILEMGTLTRLDCALGSAGLMRQALALALDHTAQRQAFGKTLIEQPLMENVLADLAVESEAATVLAMRVAGAFDRTADDPAEAALRRLATAAAKYWVCKRAPAVAAEALECLGGNGYVEESGMPRLYREAPLNSLWEGAGNINSLDVLRVLARQPEGLAALLEELAPARAAEPRLERAAATLERELGAAAGPVGLQAGARRLVERLAVLLQAALLVRHGHPAVADAFCASRVAGDRGAAFGTLPPGLDLAAIVERATPKVG
jgi:putative acyl-CoA dehydrogenase